MSESDRSQKGPKTLFSMGRPSDRRGRGDAEGDEVGADADEGAPLVPPPPPPPSGADSLDDDLVYFCGECGAELPGGAAFCGECGTPVALGDGEELIEEDLLDEELLDGDSLGADEASAVIGETDTVDEVEAPAATLYRDQDSFEPLPPPPSGSWEVAAPVMGTAAHDELAEEMADDELTEQVAGDELDESDGAGEEALEDDLEPTHASDSDIVVPAALLGAGVVGAGVAAAEGVAAADEAHPYEPLAAARKEPVASRTAGTGGPGGNKKGIWIAAAAVVAVLIIGGAVLAMSGGGKSDKSGDNVETASQVSTTTTARSESSATTAPSSSTTTTTAEPTTSTTVADVSTTTASVATTTTTRGTVTSPGPVPVPTQPTSPAYVTVSPGGGDIRIPKFGSFSISLANEGGSPGQYQVRANGLAGSTSGSLQPGAGVSLPISDTSGQERRVSVSVVAAGSGTVTISVVIG